MKYKTEKSVKPQVVSLKIYFFKDKPLARLAPPKKERKHSCQKSDWKRVIIRNTIEILRNTLEILKKYYKGILYIIYANKFDNLNEMSKFLKRYKLPKMTQNKNK